MSGFRFPPTERERCTSKTCKWEMRIWTAGRGGKFTVCGGCGERFPCAHKCKHDDCREVRRKLGNVSEQVSEADATEHDKLAPESTADDTVSVVDDGAGSAEENAPVVQSEPGSGA